MSFEDKINKFMGSLNSAKATDLADKVRDVVQPAAEESYYGNEAREDIPDMVLAEDTGIVGEQMVAGDYDFSIKAYRTEAQANRGDHASSSEPPRTGQPFGAANDHWTGTPKLPEESARTIMSRKLNYFQIERVAEIIKERLDSELKIDKERHGEEP